MSTCIFVDLQVFYSHSWKSRLLVAFLVLSVVFFMLGWSYFGRIFNKSSSSFGRLFSNIWSYFYLTTLLSKIESPYKADKEISCEIKKKRIEKEAKDKKVIIEDAKNVLKQQKLLRKGPRTKTNKIRFKERELFQKILSVQVNEKYSGVFPDEVEFKKLLYRTIDSKLDEDGDKMRDIEMELFTAFAKNEVEATHGPWEGSYENNKLADLCISKIFNTSFKNYEKSREKYEPSYFNF